MNAGPESGPDRGNGVSRTENEGLAQAGFDDYVEGLCRSFYDDRLGRPSLAPGVYFRLLLLGFLLGLDSERRIALQACDSLSLRRFLGYTLQEATPDPSTLSRTRRRIPVETHEQVFGWVLGRLREAGLAQGQAVAVDSTTLEANAALETLRRKETGESYRVLVLCLFRPKTAIFSRISLTPKRLEIKIIRERLLPKDPVKPLDTGYFR